MSRNSHVSLPGDPRERIPTGEMAGRPRFPSVNSSIPQNEVRHVEMTLVLDPLVRKTVSPLRPLSRILQRKSELQVGQRNIVVRRHRTLRSVVADDSAFPASVVSNHCVSKLNRCP